MERRGIDLLSGSRSDQAPPLMTTAAWSLRIALATAFLSAVADRFGLCGPPGAENVAWGAWAPFVDYTGVLLPFLPKGLISLSAILATAAEIVLGLWLLVPWKPRHAAFASAALLLGFALSMVLALGVKAPLNYSVFTAAAAAFLLGVITPAR
jgi:putative oxidoreductase